MVKSKEKKQERRLFFVYLLIFFTGASTLALLQPHADTPPFFANPPDEAGRYLVCRYICRYGRLPNGYDPEVRLPGYGFSYAFYTILPYILQGFAMRFVNLFTTSELALLYTARFVNVLTGTAMAAVVYRLGGRLFPHRLFKWLFCVLVMYLPQSLFVHTYVNTDSLCLFSTALIMYALVCAYQESFTVKNCLLLSAGIILCALSYYNAYGWILSSIFLFAARFFYRKEDTGRLGYDWREMLKKGCLISGVVLLGIGGLFLRNAFLYEGDFLGLESRRQSALLYSQGNIYENSHEARGIPLWQMLWGDSDKPFFPLLRDSFIACFGSLRLRGNIWMYRFYRVLFFTGIAGSVLLHTKSRRASQAPLMANPGKGRLEKAQRWFFHANMIFCIAMPLALCISYSYTVDYQPQGRYVLPGILPMMYYVASGLEKLSGLAWLPRRWEGAKPFLRRLAKGAVYAVVGAVTFFLLWMIFGYAVPVYRQIGYVL